MPLIKLRLLTTAETERKNGKYVELRNNQFLAKSCFLNKFNFKKF